MLFKSLKLEELAPILSLGSIKGWKEIPITECGERLVPLGPFSEHGRYIFQDSIYCGERTNSPYRFFEIEGSLITPFVREGVAKRLVRAASLLPPGHVLLIWDAYRPLEVQSRLFYYYFELLKREKGLPKEKALEEAQRFVSLPSDDPKRPSPHNTGGVVDLTTVRLSPEVWREMKNLNKALRSQNWHTVFVAEMRRLRLLREKSELLEMGTAFDEVSERTAARFFEEAAQQRRLSQAEEECLKNRRLLYYAMSEAGFASYEEEWWHFSYGDQFWAKKNNCEAIYGPTKFSEECREWEEMRRQHFLGSVKIWRKECPANKIGFVSTALLSFLRRVIGETGDPRHSSHPRAATL